MPDDDWAPLPPPEPPAGLDRQKAAAEAAAREATRLEGERRLEALEQKLTGQRPADPVAAAVTRAAARVDRRKKVRRDPFAEEARPRESFLRPEEVPLDVTYTEGRDPREEQEWFRGLPLPEQRRLGLRWQEQAERFTDEPKKRRKRMVRCVKMAVGVFLLAGLLQALLLGGRLPWMLLGGVVAGLLWHVSAADRFGFAAIAVAVYAVVHVPTLVASAGGSVGLVFPLLGCAVIVAHAGGWCGHRKELMQREGTW